MTSTSTDVRDRENRPAAANAAPANASAWLLWSTGAIALALGVAAFMLWGLNGPAYMLDLLAAYCG